MYFDRPFTDFSKCQEVQICLKIKMVTLLQIRNLPFWSTSRSPPHLGLAAFSDAMCLAGGSGGRKEDAEWKSGRGAATLGKSPSL